MTSQYPQVSTRPVAARPTAAATADRRARLVLRRLDPWSVLKFSLLFYLCLMLVGLLVFAVIWFVLVNMGVFEEITKFAGNFNLTVAFPAGKVFRWYIMLGLLGVVVWSVVTVLLTLLFNLINDITGGIEVVLAERDDHRRAMIVEAVVSPPRVVVAVVVGEHWSRPEPRLSVHSWMIDRMLPAESRNQATGCTSGVRWMPLASVLVPVS